MTKYQLITDLCESKVFRTKQAADKFSDAEKNEMLYAILLSTIALAQDTKTRAWAEDYAGQTAAFANFDFFRPSATDLYVLFYLASSKLDRSQVNTALRLLKGMGKGDTDDSVAQQLLLRLERSLNINDSRLRNARRVVTNWLRENEESRRDALSQLILAIQRHTRQAEVLPYLKVLTKGEAGSFGMASTLKKAATLAGAGLAGMALGYKLHDPNRRWSLFHDDVQNDKDNLSEDRATDLAGIVIGLKQHPAVERVVSVHYIADGLTALVRTKDGNAYEFQLRPAKYSRYHHDKTKKAVTEETPAEFKDALKNPNPLAKFHIYAISDVLEHQVTMDGDYVEEDYWYVRAPGYGDSGAFPTAQDAAEHAKVMFPFLIDDMTSAENVWEWQVKPVQYDEATTNLSKPATNKKPLEQPKVGKTVDAVEKQDLYPKGTIVKLGRSPIINPHFRGKEGKIIGVLDHLAPPMYIVATEFRLNPYHLYAEEFDVPQSQFYKK